MESTEINTILKKLLQDVNLDLQDVNGWTPIHLAVLVKNFDFFSVMLESKASVDVCTKKGWHPLHTLAKLCNRPNRKLPDVGGGKNKKSNGRLSFSTSLK